MVQKMNDNIWFDICCVLDGYLIGDRCVWLFYRYCCCLKIRKKFKNFVIFFCPFDLHFTKPVLSSPHSAVWP